MSQPRYDLTASVLVRIDLRRCQNVAVDLRSSTMEEQRFDSWTRGLSEGSAPRRGVLRALSAGVAGLALGLLGHLEAAAKPCRPRFEKCDGVCRRRCPNRSQSKCCPASHPTCCPRNTVLNRGCCGRRTRCCKPSPAFPQYPTGYCCNKAAGYICSTSGTPCVKRTVLGGLSNGLESQGTAPSHR